MTMETISRFHFKPIEKFSRSTAETVRILKQSVTFTASMWERMGQPKHVVFGIDSEEKAIGIKVTDERDPNGTEVLCYGKQKTPRARSASFISEQIFKELNVPDEDKVIILTHGYKFGDWYIFEERYAEIQNKCGRKAKQ